MATQVAAMPGVVDVALVERARHGDPAAFEALMATRLDRLFRTAWVILGNEADARDATQDACLSAWRMLPRLRASDRFDAWLSRVLVNACRAHLRRRVRVREIQIEPLHDGPDPANGDPAELAEMDAISRALDRLPFDTRAILVIHHLQHESVATIATAFGIPTGTVKSRLHAARADFQRALEREHR
jgi:RNA polymerase sigma-70 factor (ECF subfamily)